MSGWSLGSAEKEAFATRPFAGLEELYSEIGELTPWPQTKGLRECAEYVYSGGQTAVGSGKLRRTDRDDRPRTIVCHDMKGGYLEDRFINGSTAHDAYLFYHWNVVDTFVYFSHKMVTVPPYGWINAAHAHGVKVLGTLITELGDGERIWERALSTRDETEKLANALVGIAKFYGFEGWLLNVENKMKPESIGELIYFVKYLTDEIHSAIEGSEIIWYDSVTHDGQLNWQNELNDQNENFFNNCDGIFLNYNWSDSSLARSRAIAQRTNRIRDVYVGLDVWGRGCPGGGGFNSAHALERIRKQDLSVAIFAPGWTHEYFGPKTFDKIENIFWAQLIPHLYIHVPIYDKETFATSFCRGSGMNYYRLGQPESETSTENGISTMRSFYNLSMQKPQILAPGSHLKFTFVDIPTYVEPKDKNSPKERPESTFETPLEIMKVNGKKITFVPKNPTSPLNYVDFCNDFSYNGGSCLKFVTEDTSSYHRLFLVHIEFDREMEASLVYKETDDSGEPKKLSDDGPDLILGNGTRLRRIRCFQTMNLNNQWRKNIYLTNMRTVNEIGVIFSRTGNCCLGEFVIETNQRRLPRNSIENLESEFTTND